MPRTMVRSSTSSSPIPEHGYALAGRLDGSLTLWKLPAVGQNANGADVARVAASGVDRRVRRATRRANVSSRSTCPASWRCGTRRHWRRPRPSPSPGITSWSSTPTSPPTASCSWSRRKRAIQLWDVDRQAQLVVAARRQRRQGRVRRDVARRHARRRDDPGSRRQRTSIEIWNLTDGTAIRHSARRTRHVRRRVVHERRPVLRARSTSFGGSAAYRVADGVNVAFLTPEDGTTTLTGGPLGGHRPRPRPLVHLRQWQRERAGLERGHVAGARDVSPRARREPERDHRQRERVRRVRRRRHDDVGAVRAARRPPRSRSPPERCRRARASGSAPPGTCCWPASVTSSRCGTHGAQHAVRAPSPRTRADQAVPIFTALDRTGASSCARIRGRHASRCATPQPAIVTVEKPHLVTGNAQVSFAGDSVVVSTDPTVDPAELVVVSRRADQFAACGARRRTVVSLHSQRPVSPSPSGSTTGASSCGTPSRSDRHRELDLGAVPAWRIAFSESGNALGGG